MAAGMNPHPPKPPRVPIRVGATYRSGVEPEPEHVHIGTVTYDVAEVVDRWYQGPRRAGEPVWHYYKIRSRGDSVFLIAYDPRQDGWFLVRSFGPEVPT